MAKKSTFEKADEAAFQEIAAALDAAEKQWMAAQAAVNETTPCPECGGRGAVALGSLGDFCLTCEGTGQIDSILDDEPITYPPELAEIKTRCLTHGELPKDVPATIARIKELGAGAKLAAKGKVSKAAQPLLDAKDREIDELKRRLQAAESKKALPDVEDLNRED